MDKDLSEKLIQVCLESVGEENWSFFDKLVENSKNEIRKGKISQSCRNLLAEFDRQKSILVQKYSFQHTGLTQEFVNSSLNKLSEILSKDKISFDSGNIPFILVIPSTWIPVQRQFSLVFPKSLYSWEDYLYSQEISGDSSEVPYLAINIDPGCLKPRHNRPHRSGDMVEKKLKEKGRNPLTILEGLSLIHLFPELYTNHTIHFLGSRFRSSISRAKTSYSNGKIGPLLIQDGSYNYDVEVAPSCGSRTRQVFPPYDPW